MARSISSSQTDDQNSIPCRDTSSQSDLIADIEIFKENEMKVINTNKIILLGANLKCILKKSQQINKVPRL